MDTLLPASQSALLLVDVQETPLGCLPTDIRAHLLQSTQGLVEVAVALGIPIFTSEHAASGSAPEPLRAALPPPMIRDGFSALSHPDLLPALNTSGRRRVVVVGAPTHGSVFLTARDLVLEGFITQVPHDATGSEEPADHAVGLELLRQAGVVVSTSETIVLDWLQGAAHPAAHLLGRFA